MHCPSCQREHPEGIKFCPVTGARLNHTDFERPYRQCRSESSHSESSISWGRAIALAFRKYAVFTGRATRAEYWWLYLTVALTWIPSLFCLLMGLPNNSYEWGFACGACGLIACIINLVFLLPIISCGVRRLHDTNKSGWHLLWGIIPYVGWLIPLIMLVQPTQSGANRFGEEPLAI